MANVSGSTSAIVDRIYEAAFVPEGWPKVLDALASLAGAATGQIIVFDDLRPIEFQATGLIWDSLSTFSRDGHWKDNRRIQHFQRNPFTGFVTAEAYFSQDFLDADRPFRESVKLGLRAQAGTMISLPTGELVVYAFERWERDGDFRGSDLDRFNRIHPHLARAGLIAARLGLEKAQAKVAALAAIGLPAAVMTQSGRVLATNDLLDALTSTFRPSAFGGMTIADAGADRLFQEARAAARDAEQPVVRSFPLAATEDRPALVVHVLPLVRAAYDLFAGGHVLVVATVPTSSALVPSPTILMGLFDLTPAEARLATALTAGKSLKAAAADSRVTFGTARTYLDRIYRKTGTNQQSQLVALLKTVEPVRVS
jgi:DNA-binding CsgD family transcriptional regulator